VNAVGKSGETLIDSVRKYKNKTLKTRFSQSVLTEYRQSGKLSIVLLNIGLLNFRELQKIKLWKKISTQVLSKSPMNTKNSN